MAELKSKSRDKLLKLLKSEFAEPDKRAYPIEHKDHASNAKVRSTQAVNARPMSKAEKAKIDRKVDAVLDKG